MTHTAIFPTAIGDCGLSWGDHGIRSFHLPAATPQQLIRQLKGAGATLDSSPQERLIRRAVSRVQKHLEGAKDTFHDISLDFRGLSPFRRSIYQCARRIEPGSTASYMELAHHAGKRGAMRAIGQAMAQNNIPLLIPCHRVLRSDGDLGGFSAHGGVATKLRLLTIEGADLTAIAQAGVRALKQIDERLGALIRRVSPYHLPRQQRADPFTALVETIVHQQLSMKAGATIFGRLKRTLGGGRHLDAEVLLRTPTATFRQIGLSRQKASYIEDLCQKGVSGQIPWRRLSRMDDEQVIDALVQIKGIGRWSAEMFLMFRLGRLNVLPASDLGLKKGVQLTYHLRALPSDARLQRLAAPWTPFRSIATWYLWRALDGDTGLV